VLIREYDQRDWDAIARIHDAARPDELRDSAGLDAFLTLGPCSGTRSATPATARRSPSWNAA
jgi:hypothetical protein